MANNQKIDINAYLELEAAVKNIDKMIENLQKNMQDFTLNDYAMNSENTTYHKEYVDNIDTTIVTSNYIKPAEGFCLFGQS